MYSSVVEPNLAMTSSTMGDSGETLLLADEDTRLADIIEGGSWSSVDSDPKRGMQFYENSLKTCFKTLKT